MAFQTQDQSEELMSEINMTPLVDVMLVLLIIFMVTVPLMRQSVLVELPRANTQAIATAATNTPAPTSAPWAAVIFLSTTQPV